MKKFFRFVAVGSFFATVEEFLTVVILRNDIASYLFTLLILFPVFLVFVWFSSHLIDRFIRNSPVQELTHFVIFGIIGLMIEWFAIGLAPWSDPTANPALMLVFQLGMFSFWATVAFAPRLFLSPRELNKKVRKAILRFYIPYFALVYLVGLVVPHSIKFATIISLILFGYLFLNVFYVRYFSQSFSHSAQAQT